MRMPKILSFTRLAIFLPVALISLFASPVKAAANEIINPTFSSAGGGWAGASGGASCSGGNPSLGSWQANALNFSYVWNVVTQTVVISQPSEVEFSYTVQDRAEAWINGRYSVSISDEDQSVTSGIVVAPDQQTTLNLSLTTTQPNEVVTIAIGGDDNGLFWAGCYGPIFTNAQISVAQIATGYPADQQWEAVTYGDGKFVAVASSGSGNRVMTSTNGTYWTSRTSASNSNWQGIAYADGLFVAVGSNAVMTSPDGITWTSRTAPNGEWQAITNCGGLFVATATWGSNYVMTSTNGIDWTVRTPAYAWSHDAVACSASVPRFVSVSQFGRGWSSADGISNWSIQNPGAIVDIRTVAFGAGRFSWLEYSTNTGNRYGAYSTNGVNWTNTASAPANQWRYITYGGNKFIAVAEGGVNSRSAYSADGANWTLGSGVPDNSWQGVAYGANKYVAVANSGTNNRVMTSSDGQSWESLAVTVPYFNAARNLTAIANANGSVNLDWDAPISSNSDIYAYGVTFYDLDEIGGTTSGGWGVWTNQGTNYSLAENMFSGTTGFGPVRFGIKAGNESCFSAEGVGPCVYGPETTIDVMVVDPTPPTTTTSTATTTTIPETTIPETTIPETTIPETTIPKPEVTSTTEVIIEDVTTTTEQEVPTATTIEVEPEPQQEDSKIDENVNDPSPETTVFEPDAVQEDAEEEAAPPIVVEPTSSDELVNDILSGEATDEQVDAFLEDVLSDGVTDEAIEDVVDIINTGTLDPEQVQEIIDEILAEEIDSDQAVQLATSPELLASITSEQAEEIFASVDTGDLSDEEASQIVAAVQNAVESVRKAFETEINVFGGKFDIYVPTGSRVTVAERRVLVAAGAVLFMAPVVSTSSINTTTSNSAPNRKQ